MSGVRYFGGLDLGRPHEYTALAVVERTQPSAAWARTALHYAVRYLERFPPGTPYAAAFARMKELYDTAPLAGSTVLADQTAVGRPVLAALEDAKPRATVVPVTLTAGHTAVRDDRGGWLVPRKELVGTLQVLLQAGRLKVAGTLPAVPELLHELETFRPKVSLAGSDEDLAWREGPRDDLVLAVGLACWWGERVGPCGSAVPMVYMPHGSWDRGW